MCISLHFDTQNIETWSFPGLLLTPNVNIVFGPRSVLMFRCNMCARFANKNQQFTSVKGLGWHAVVGVVGSSAFRIQCGTLPVFPSLSIYIYWGRGLPLTFNVNICEGRPQPLTLDVNVRTVAVDSLTNYNPFKHESAQLNMQQLAILYTKYRKLIGFHDGCWHRMSILSLDPAPFWCSVATCAPVLFPERYQVQRKHDNICIRKMKQFWNRDPILLSTESGARGRFDIKCQWIWPQRPHIDIWCQCGPSVDI